MASKSVAFFLVLAVATCSLVLIIDVQAAAAAAAAGDYKDSGHGCFPTEGAVSLKSTQNRKMVAGLKEKNNELVGVELRKVPSGPDPLHHNGNSPKPRTDP